MAARRSKRSERRTSSQGSRNPSASSTPAENVSSHQGNRSPLSQWLIVMLVVLLGIGLIVINTPWAPKENTTEVSRWQEMMASRPSSTDDPSRVFSANHQDGFIGSEACRECHAQRYQDFLATPHANSFTSAERLTSHDDAELQHPLSSRRYLVESDQDGHHWHEETLVDRDGNLLAKNRKRIDFAVGSGAYGITPLHVENGYLLQSPLTMYADSGTWQMSPGYDKPHHLSFQRIVTRECLFCHTGQIHVDPQNALKMQLSELSIGCERCHGPGERHKQVFEDAVPGSIPTETQIVHPGNLSRELSEAVCQQCHLQAADFYTSDGESVWDFRPGEALSDNRTDFQKASVTGHRLVGHVEQLHQSRCYTESTDMTCISCHDPHHQERPESKVDFHRSACMACHENEACGVELSVRRSENENACSDCHMPKLPTNVAHVALHHHTIAVYPRKEVSTSVDERKAVASESSIRPVLSQEGLDSSELKRRSVLSKIELALQDESFEISDSELVDGYRWLRKEVQRGTTDRSVLIQVARFANETGDHETAMSAAEQLVGLDQKDDATHSIALEILASLNFQAGRNAVALRYYEQLVQERPVSTDHYFLALCLRNAGRDEEAMSAIEEALRLQPDLIPAHEFLAVTLQGVDDDRASIHAEMVRRLGQMEDALSSSP